MLAFPDEFLWGVSTSAYQVEGAVHADGRGPSIWDTFSHQPGVTHHGDDGDVACDQYRRFEADSDLMAELGIRAYRFSISWPRIQPDGKGLVNEKGLDHYRRLVDVLLGHGIEPVPTLFHWDLPQALEDVGGWPSRDTASRFGAYAEIVGRALGDRVSWWITHNEPWCAAFLGHATGVHAPGRRDVAAAITASHHLLLSHGLAARALREAVGDGARIGIALNPAPVFPASTSVEDVAAAQRLDDHLNRWFIDPVLLGSYPKDLLEESLRLAGAFLHAGDLEIIHADLDFLGVNYYTPRRVAALRPSKRSPVARGEVSYDEWLGVEERPDEVAARTSMGWTIEPEGLADLLVRLDADYGNIPIVITENGAGFEDYVDPNGRVKDPERVDYLREHLAAAHAAVERGVDLQGYFVWSLLDNFEWAEGYSKRFGIVYVDYRTQTRIPKTSARWYRDVIARHGVEVA